MPRRLRAGMASSIDPFEPADEREELAVTALATANAARNSERLIALGLAVATLAFSWAGIVVTVAVTIAVTQPRAAFSSSELSFMMRLMFGQATVGAAVVLYGVGRAAGAQKATMRAQLHLERLERADAARSHAELVAALQTRRSRWSRRAASPSARERSVSFLGYGDRS